MLTGPTPSDLLLFDQRMTAPLIEETAIGNIAVYSDRRPGKKIHNEDSAAVILLDRHSLLLVVADGLGARGAGEQASRQAIVCIQSAVSRAIAAKKSINKAVIGGIGWANQEIRKMNNGAATTLAAAFVLPGMVRTYHVGDSKIVIIGGGGRKNRQTIDHSCVDHARQNGKHSGNSNGHSDSHIVTNAIGMSQMFIDVGGRTDLQHRDTLLLGTDGLFDNLPPDEILQLIAQQSLQDTAEHIREIVQSRMLANLASGNPVPGKPDDLTFILFQPKQAGAVRAG